MRTIAALVVRKVKHHFFTRALHQSFSIIKQIDGRLFPFGFLKILFGRKKLNKIRLVSTNVVPEFQMWGVGLILVERLVDYALAWGINEAEFSWVLESNTLSRGTLERGGAIRQKTYRIYDRQIA